MAADRLPAWLDAIGHLVDESSSSSPDQVEPAGLKPAAVLVLVIDSGSGPLLALTERARTLRNYPGILVFPGGSAEPGDDSPITTALREAAEETGIDPDDIHVIGSLPPLALPETGFLVTPIVGWCTRLRCNGVNADEVADIVQVPLGDFGNGSGRVRRVRPENNGGSGFTVDGTALGEMTAAVIDSLLPAGSNPRD